MVGVVASGSSASVVASGSSALESTVTGTLILIILVIYCGMFKLLHGGNIGMKPSKIRDMNC